MKEVVVKPPFPLPYNGTINDGSCLGLKNNHCLFTQCELKRVVNSDYCKTCVAQSEKNSNGKPDYGTITDRSQVGIMDYRDPKETDLYIIQNLLKTGNNPRGCYPWS